MSLSYQGRRLCIDEKVEIRVQWPILQAMDGGGAIYVLLDPDAYLADPGYLKSRRLGVPAIKNLVAFSRDGEMLWEAAFPEDADYYYSIDSVDPLTARSFSSFRCEIDPDSGAILNKEFLK